MKPFGLESLLKVYATKSGYLLTATCLGEVQDARFGDVMKEDNTFTDREWEKRSRILAPVTLNSFFGLTNDITNHENPTFNGLRGIVNHHKSTSKNFTTSIEF